MANRTLCGSWSWHRLCLTLVLPAVLAAGCGFAGFAYDHAESVTLLWADRYIDLSPDQRMLAHSELAHFYAWHRQNELPDYAAFASEAEWRLAAVDRGRALGATDVAWLEDGIRARWQRAVEAAAPGLTDLVLSVRPDQLPRLEHAFAVNDARYESDFVSGTRAHQLAARDRKILERLEYWFGDFTEEQRRILVTALDSEPYDPVLWLAERQSREREFVALVDEIARTHPARAEVEESLKRYAARLSTSPDATRARYIERLDQANRAVWLKTLELLTPGQRAHAEGRLENWVRDLRDWSQPS